MKECKFIQDDFCGLNECECNPNGCIFRTIYEDGFKDGYERGYDEGSYEQSKWDGTTKDW